MSKFCLYFFLLILLISTSASPSIDFQIEVITAMNDASAMNIDNNKIFVATSGGLLIYDLLSEGIQKYTAGNGFYSQQFTALEKTPQNIFSQAVHTCAFVSSIVPFVSIATLA